jgi:hypothetical protein
LWASRSAMTIITGRSEPRASKSHEPVRLPTRDYRTKVI